MRRVVVRDDHMRSDVVGHQFSRSDGRASAAPRAAVVFAEEVRERADSDDTHAAARRLMRPLLLLLACLASLSSSGSPSVLLISTPFSYLPLS